MAGFTIIDFDAASQAISTFQGKNAALTEACTAINNTIQGLTGGIWSGEAATTFFGKFFELYANLSKTEVKVDSAIEKLNQALIRYAEANGIAGQLADSVQGETAPNIF